MTSSSRVNYYRTINFGIMTHNFNTTLAERYGIEAAILIEHIYWWIHKNDCEEVEEMIHEGKVWCRSTAKGFAKYIPYMKPDKIWRVLRKLEGHVLVVGNFNKKALNQTLWYTFTDEFKKELKQLNYDFENFKNANLKNEKSYNSIINNPINKEDDIIEDKKKLSNDNSKEGLDFDSFYKLYPLKRSRKAAEKAWGKLSVKDKKEAIKKLPAYIADCYMQKRKFQYPATYLNGATWNDDFSDSYEEEVNEEIPEERLEGWHHSQDWMNKAIPRIAGKIGFKDFDTMRGTVYHNRDVFSEILHEINNSDYEGDIVAEFCRLAQTERYNQKIFGV